ncbi:MAG: YkgJ family cysteine cluster protein [Phototrophicaceae bacterium]
MTLITDLDLLSTLADEKRDEFEVMLYQLQNDDDLDDMTIDAVANAIAQPIIEAIDCTECGNCCRNLDVQLGEDDLERLATGINIPISEIRQNVTVQDIDDPDIVGIFKAQPCTFLEGNLCTVYEHRPTSCRDYPQFTPDFRWMLGWMIEGSHLCPIIYNVLIEMLKQVDTLQREEN